MVAGLHASATDAGGLIRVTVGSSGAVTGLELHDRVRALRAVDLAESILRVMRRAQSALADQVARAVDATVGVDSEAGRATLDAYIRRFPPQPREEPEVGVEPVMPAPPFPTFPEAVTFPSRPNFPHQPSGPHRRR
jgi:hypothetical protein